MYAYLAISENVELHEKDIKKIYKQTQPLFDKVIIISQSKKYDTKLTEVLYAAPKFKDVPSVLIVLQNATGD